MTPRLRSHGPPLFTTTATMLTKEETEAQRGFLLPPSLSASLLVWATPAFFQLDPYPVGMLPCWGPALSPAAQPGPLVQGWGCGSQESATAQEEERRGAWD